MNVVMGMTGCGGSYGWTWVCYSPEKGAVRTNNLANVIQQAHQGLQLPSCTQFSCPSILEYPTESPCPFSFSSGVSGLLLATRSLFPGILGMWWGLLVFELLGVQVRVRRPLK